MKILQIGKFYPPHRGGIENHLQILCRQLSRSVDLQVIVSSSNGRSVREAPDGFPVTRLRTAFQLAGAPVCLEMAAKVRQSRADIVHIHLPNPTAILAFFGSGHRGRLVMTYHSDVVRQRVLGTLFQPILNHAMRRSDAVIAASPNYLESSPVLTRFRERCEVIPFGIPLESFEHYDRRKAEEIRLRYGPHILLAVGRLVYYKGFEFLIRAMSQMKAHLLLLGEGPLRPALQRLVQRQGLEHRVTILGDIDDLIPYYRAADVFVLPSISRSEAFGIVQLEAMACRKPVVNTKLNSGVPFVSQDGVSGYTVPPRDSAALAAAINRLLRDPGLRERYGEAARLRVEREFSAEVMTRRMLNLYERVHLLRS